MKNPRSKSVLSVSNVSAALLLTSFGTLVFCFFTQSLMASLLLLVAVLPWAAVIMLLHRKFAESIVENQRFSEMKAQDQWAENSRRLAEDIRGPLTVLTTISQLSHEMSSDKSELLRLAVLRLRGLVDDFFKNGPPSLAQEFLPMSRGIPSVELTSVLSPLLKEYQFSHPQTHWTLHNHLTSQNAVVEMNQIQLQRILSHLFNNALDAVPEKEATIEVTLLERPGHYLLQIMDNGCGIPEALLPKLAQPGVSYGKERAQGLGLFQARKNLEVLGGELQIRSREGVGTQVILLFPKKFSSQEPQVM